MDSDAIAIIGVAFRLPDASTLDELHLNLAAGRDSVRAPAPDRVRYAGGTPGTDYIHIGYLDRVDQFDHQFFGISLGEAELMDPHQRLGLHLVHEAIENACYAPGRLRGSATSVIVSAPNPSYATLHGSDDPQQILGSLPAAMAARIAYLFDFAGPSFVVDTACSSSLGAVALSMEKLRSGQVDLAIAGGVSIESVLHPQQSYSPLLGVVSEGGVCRPFDAKADGTIGGEGGGFVVLKRLSDALADGDNVHGVLRGVAVNHNGSSATSMSAPSARAQAAAITAAWRDARVHSGTIGYIECHGSGTALGDVVEAEGLRQAFGSEPGPCPIGAVKGNFGHLDHAAGMAGLFKVIAGLRYSTLYQPVHFETPNPLIDFTGPFTVQAETADWPEPAGQPRRAGLSSFGLTGTNVHVVIEQPPATDDPGSDAGTHLVTVSAKTPAALERYAGLLTGFLDDTRHSIARVAFALNSGRDDHAYRWAFTVNDTKELAEALRSAEVHERPAPPEVQVVLMFSGDANIDDTAWVALTEQFTVLDPALDGTLRRQHALYELLGSLGLDSARLVGSGPGNHVVRLIRDENADTAILDSAPAPSSDVDLDGLRRAVRGFAAENAICLEMSADGVLSRRIAELAPDLPVVRLLSDGVLAALGRLYELGSTVDWTRHYADFRLPRLEAPTYPFEPVSCWCDPVQAPEKPQASVVTRTDPDAERAVAEIWTRVLKAENVGPDSDYFELGGTSIAGISVLHEIRQRFGAQLMVKDLYEHRTVGGLAALIEQRRSRTVEDLSIPVVRRDGVLPLSVNQEQLWYIEQLAPGGALYNIPTDLRYSGPLNREVLQRAFADLVERHEIMRIRMVADDNGRPRILVDAPLPELRIAHTTPEELPRLLDAEATKGFDLAGGPMVRATLFAVSEDDHLLLCTWHHIIFDGWAPRLFLRDLTEFYSARLDGRSPRLPELPIQYVDFAAWQRSWLTSDRRERGLEYWRAQLDGAWSAELPLDRPRPAVESHAGALLDFMLRPQDAIALREFSRQEGVTTFVTMLAVVDALMYVWAGHEDVVVGAATTGRTNPATHELIGYFNNLLPFRTKLDGDVTFRELVRRCAETVTGALDHEEIPFGEIVADLKPRRDPSRHAFFTVAYTHQNTMTHPADLPGLTVTTPEEGGFGIAPGTSKFDLTIGVSDQDDGPMRGCVEYATDLFDGSTMAYVAELYQHIITAAMDNPDRPMSDFRGEPLGVWDAIRRHDPGHVAIVDGEQAYTYGDLVERVQANPVRAGEIVPVVARRGADMVVGWLSALASGAAFVPIDATAPDDRIGLILDDVRGHSGDGLAYIAFTSGSTGRPHGCMITHDNLVNLLRWYGQRLNLSEKDNAGQSFAAGFDGAVVEVLGALYHGSTIHFMPQVQSTPASMLRWVADHRITVLSLPTPMAELLLADYTAVPGSALRVLWTGGDRLRVRPPATLPFTVLNLYGPTECAVVSTCGLVTPSGEDMPDIGHPIAGATAYILDETGNPVGDGRIGEVYIGGDAVGLGYHQQPGLTAGRFVADPFAAKPGARMYRTGDLAARKADGAIQFHGRADFQIALNGHRIEPAEIERALVAQPGVREAVVVRESLPTGAQRLAAHVSGENLAAEPLIAGVAGLLPAHMVPARVVVHTELPKTANGKFDRVSLSQETAMTPITLGPATAARAEQVLTGIWRELLGRDHIGLDEDFFQIGGDSILSVGVAARAARSGVAITPQDVLQYPTLRTLCAVASAPEPEPVTGQEGPILLTPLVKRMLEEVGDPSDFVVIEVMDVAPGVSADVVRAAVAKLTEIQEPLRYRFRRNSLGWRIDCAAEAGHVSDSVVLPPVGHDAEIAMLVADKDELMRDIDIKRGPLLRSRFYDRGPARGGVLAMLIHHFVYDEITTVPLLEDLNAALVEIMASGASTQQARPAAWRAWARHLHDMAQSDELAGEVAYWDNVLTRGRAISAVPELETPGEPGIIHRTVRADGLAGMLTQPGAPSREAVLAAVACAWSRWRGEPNAFVSTVGYGTSNVFRDKDRSQSFGWFTNSYPLLLPVQPNAPVPDALPAIVDTIKAVPNDGVGYGILRHLSPQTDAVARIRAKAEPQLLLEHKVSGVDPIRVGDGLVTINQTPMSVNNSESLLTVMSVILVTAVIDGELQLYLAHHGRFDGSELAKFADQLEIAFTELAGLAAAGQVG
jgi:amino acid adenylation domain-containing protein